MALAVAASLLMVAWIAATPPFGGPDEADHYLRALDIADGQVLGPRVPLIDPALPPAQVAWAAKDTRGVLAIPRRSPPGRPCAGAVPADRGAGCLRATHTGDYQPLPYALPALAVAASSRADTGLWLARGASVLQCLVFLLIAGCLLWDGSVWSLMGLMAALTPMAVFVAAVVNPNGLEVAAGLALTAGVLRIARARSAVGAAVVAITVVSAVVTILAWQLGPVFAVVNAVLLGALLGGEGARELYRRRRRAVWIAGAAIAASLGAFLGYGLAAGLLHSTVSITLSPGLRLGIGQLGTVFRQWVGEFGQETIPLPLPLCLAWWVVVALLAAAAWRLGDRRERGVLALVVALAFVFPVVLFGWVYRFTGFDLQGRYLIPVLSLVPLSAGEIVARHRRALAPGAARIAAAGTVLMAAVQLVAWWVAARHAAAPHAPLWFVNAAAWSPPLGWWPWAALCVAGSAGLAAGAVSGLRATRLDPASAAT